MRLLKRSWLHDGVVRHPWNTDGSNAEKRDVRNKSGKYVQKRLKFTPPFG
jgi:hypothetical protein